MLLILTMETTVIISASGVGVVVVVARLLIEMMGSRQIDMRTRLYLSVRFVGLKYATLGCIMNATQPYKRSLVT